jgi:hypothetical protein
MKQSRSIFAIVILEISDFLGGKFQNIYNRHKILNFKDDYGGKSTEIVKNVESGISNFER